MLRNFQSYKEGVKARRNYVVKEESPDILKIDDTHSKWEYEYRYLKELSEKLSKYDPEIFACERISREKNKQFKRLYIVYPTQKRERATVVFLLNEDSVHTANEMLDEYMYYERDILSGSEFEKGKLILNAAMEEVLNYKEYRLKYLTGMLKVMDA